MTGNQIRFNEYRETKRHNKVSEIHEHRKIGVEQQKADASTLQAQVSLGHLGETTRHNKETERQNWWNMNQQLAETQRHNRYTEGVSAFSAVTGRHQAETQRYAAETARAKVGLDYEIGSRQAAASERQASVAERNASTNAYNAYTNRQHISLGYAQLAELNRHSMAVEAETNRSNRANELIGLRNAWNTQSYNRAMANAARANATTNRISADIRQQEADTHRYSATSGTLRDELAQRETAASEKRATANTIAAWTGVANTAISGFSAWNRAKTDRINAVTRRRESTARIQNIYLDYFNAFGGGGSK